MAIDDCGGRLACTFLHVVVKTEDGEQKVRQKIPLVSLGITLIIFAGVVLIQIPHAQSVELRTLLLGIIPVVFAAFAYPLGNRKMMELLGGRLDTFQRVLGMTLMTIPVWIGFVHLCVMDSRTSFYESAWSIVHRWYQFRRHRHNVIFHGNRPRTRRSRQTRRRGSNTVNTTHFCYAWRDGRFSALRFQVLFHSLASR